MLDPAVILGSAVVVGTAPSALTVALRSKDRHHWHDTLETYRLRLPGDLDLDAVTTFLGGLSGMLPARWKRPFTVTGLGIEVVGSEIGIAHYLVVPNAQRGVVLSHLRAALPNVGIVLDPDYRTPMPTLAGELTTTSSAYPLRIDHPETTSTAILAAIGPLEVGESLVVQLLMSPLGHSQAPTPGQSFWTVLTQGAQPTPEPPKPVRDKFSKPVFGVTLRIGAVSATPERDRQLLRQLSGAFHASNSEYATLHRRWSPNRQLRRALHQRYLPLVAHASRLNSLELAGLVALPPANTTLPGLQLGGSRQLAPSSIIDRQGRVLADSNFPGTARPLALSVSSSMTHLHAIGPTGVGKSTLLLSLIAQDAAANRCVVVVDPKQDLATDALDLIPLERDVVVIDAMDDRPVGLNVFAGGVEDPELVTEQVLGILRKIWSAFWGPRTDDILRHALSTLVRIPGSSFAELSLLLTDPAFRRQIVGQIDDPISLQPFWQQFENMSDGERLNACGPVLNKLRAVHSRPRLRRILGQADSLVDFDDVLASAKVVVVPLAAGVLGDAAELLGSFVLQKLWQAIQRRVRLPQSERPPAMVVLDEFQMMMNVGNPLPDVLAQARAMNVAFHLAHQNLAQLDRETLAAVLANCRSRVCFQLPAGDARTLAPYFAPQLTAQDLASLGPYRVAMTLAAGGSVAPPVTGQTRPAPEPLGHGQEHRARSRQRYGRPAAEIDAQLRDRRAQLSVTAQVGRQRRPR